MCHWKSPLPAIPNRVWSGSYKDWYSRISWQQIIVQVGTIATVDIVVRIYPLRKAQLGGALKAAVKKEESSCLKTRNTLSEIRTIHCSSLPLTAIRSIQHLRNPRVNPSVGLLLTRVYKISAFSHPYCATHNLHR
jgi:hypothetical protein